MIRAYLSYWHKDAKGKTIKYRRYRSDSFVGNLLKIISYMFGNTTTFSQSDIVNSINIPTTYRLRNTSGTTYQYMPAWVANPLEASAGNDTLGIVVGSGSTAVTLNDYNLVSQIPHGTTAGRLAYGAMPATNVTPINTTLGNSWYYSVSRNFSNLGTTSIGIYEVGLIAYIVCGATSFFTDKFLIARDVLQSPIILAPNESTIIKYTFSLTI